MDQKHDQNKLVLSNLNHVLSCSFQYQAFIIINIWVSMHFQMNSLIAHIIKGI
jgi:hypothetical protein